MDKVNIEKLIDCINIPEISPKTNFWLIRTKKGYFYDEYVNNGFVALGWNIISKKVIKEYENGKDKEPIYEELKEKYKVNQPGRPYNKCKRFIYDVKENDIIMIPGRHNSEITFALAGEYYEEQNLNYAKEKEIVALIETGWKETLDIKCPYKKRRTIKVLKTVSGSKLNPNLYKALISYHGISKINNYSDYILSSIYNIYYWKNKINYVFNVEKEREINPIDISKFIMSFAELSKEILLNKTDIDKLNGKMNINSPGDIVLSLKNCGTDVYDFVVTNKWLFVLIWSSVCGGSFNISKKGVNISSKSILEYILKFREQSNKFKNDKVKRRLIEQQMEILSEKSDKLNVNKKNLNNVIDLKDYFNDND